MESVYNFSCFMMTLWQLERVWRAKKTDESHQAFKQQAQKLNQMIRDVKEEYYATHGGGPVSCLRYSLNAVLD